MEERRNSNAVNDKKSKVDAMLQLESFTFGCCCTTIQSASSFVDNPSIRGIKQIVFYTETVNFSLLLGVCFRRLSHDSTRDPRGWSGGWRRMMIAVHPKGFI